MRRSFWKLFLLGVAVLALASPLSASADVMSVSQVITITATVPPMRSIIVNDAGQMTIIYSNTNQNVTPKVFQNSTSNGPQLPLTPQLSDQYEKIMNNVHDPIGIAIPVSITNNASNSSLVHTLFKSVSIISIIKQFE